MTVLASLGGAQSLKLIGSLARVLIVTGSLLLVSPVSASFQDQPVVTSGIVEDGIALNFEVRGTAYQKENTVTVRYRVENKRKQNIYLVIGEKVIPGVEPNKKELWMSLEKSILTYHYFDFPKLEKVEPGKIYQGIASLSPSVLKDRFSAGRWLLYLSIGYFDNNGMAEARDLLKRYQPSAFAQQFERLQKIRRVGPVEIELVE